MTFKEYVEEQYPLGALAESPKFITRYKNCEGCKAVRVGDGKITNYQSILASDTTPNKRAAIEVWLDKLDVDTVTIS